MKFALGLFWIWLYLLVVLAPLFVLIASPVPSGRSALVELSVAFGFMGLTQLALQFALTARFRTLTAPYGIDVILRYHRQIAVVAILLIFAHPILLVIDYPPRLELLNPLGGNWASRLGWVSIFALAAIAVTSIFRKKLKLGYERWRLMHLVFGVAALIFAQLHVSMAGLYINTFWNHAIWIGVALVMVGFELRLRVIRPALARRRPWTVVEVRPERGNSYSVVLEAEGHAGLRFEPGQFAWMRFDRFTLDEHPFSFSSSATEPRRIEFGIKALGDFTTQIGETPVGTRAYVDGAYGAFSIDRYPAAGYVFIAGGIGITPILSCLRTMADRNDPRPALLLNAQKNLEQATFREAISALEDRLDLEVVYVVEEAEESWVGERGYIDDAVLDRRLPREQIVRNYFLCGPPPMMNAVRDALKRRGVTDAQIHLERFDLV